MAEPTTNTVIFKQGNRLRGEIERNVTYIASRPEMLPVLKNLDEHDWGWLLTFRGTEAELVAAGVASIGMFDIGRSVQRKCPDEYGDDCTLYRRGKSRWEIQCSFHNVGYDALPTDERPTKCPWWVKWGGEAEAATAEILKRFARVAP